MKRDEDQLLTVGSQVYSSEARYSVSHSRHQKMWELSIRDVRFSDAGLYECQLTTHPPASLFFWLRVVEARAVIRGGPAVHVPTGGRFTLHCAVHLATETPSYIFWFHNGTMVNFLPRRGLRVEPRGHASSVLRVSRVMWQDAGTYTCEPHRAVPANMTVHVVEEMWLEVLAVVVALVAVLLGYSKYKRAYWSFRGVPSAPNSLPFVGHTVPLMKKASWLYTDKLYREQGANKVLGLYLFHVPRLFVTDPELVKTLLVKDFDHFADRVNLSINNEEEEYLNELLTKVKGDHWKGVRSVLSPSFTSGRLKTMFPLVEDKADQLITYIKKQIKSDPAIQLKETFGLYTLEVISSCAFGVETNALTDGNSIFKEKVDALSKPSKWRILKILGALMIPWVYKILKIRISTPENTFFKEVVEENIRKREKGEKRGDFLDIMLEAREDQQNPSAKTPKYKLENKTVVANSFLFIIAGFDTTATTLSLVTFQLARYKHYQDRVREELREIIKENGTLTYQTVMETKLLDAVIQETLRMYPPAHATERQCTKEYKLAEPEITITSDVVITVPIWSLHHDPRYWEAPGTFMPERFLPENKDKIVSGTFLPFGLGPRNCIGMRFALMETKIALAKTLLNFQISCVPGEEELMLDPTPGLLRAAKNTRLVFTPLE
ncbi:hypothetical protein O3P69_004780 [Scylla paramamosain]